MNSGFLGPAIATVLTACGIETDKPYLKFLGGYANCNSTYRLRY